MVVGGGGVGYTLPLIQFHIFDSFKICFPDFLAIFTLLTPIHVSRNPYIGLQNSCLLLTMNLSGPRGPWQIGLHLDH